MANGAATLANGALGQDEMRQGSERESMVKAYEQQHRRSYDTDMRPINEDDFAALEEEEEDDSFRYQH